eukprot:TRINITY_DN89603_c0_g1_i1.p1 TRINITY_DN89603_c0_g1~~TRINITY_DN89603_c0_g1_i1.p1  ORF type:complete len:397 (-),score=110.98 TRINITY_DN89603_c0_g1_i1:16-1206(-)
MMMRDPEEEAAERAAKAEMEHRKLAKRAAMANVGWEDFLQYFLFCELSWIAREYYSHVDAAGTEISKAGANEVVSAWIRYRWGGENRSMEGLEVVPEICDAAFAKAGINPNAETLSLTAVVKYVYHYQKLHLAAEKTAGWNRADIDAFEEVFDCYRYGQEQVKAKELWDILRDLGQEFPTIEEQRYLLSLVKEADADRSGSISFQELLHLMRMLQEDEKVKARQRENELLVKSGMSLEDCEEWLHVFEACCPENQGFLILSDFKGLFDVLELDYGMEESRTIAKWLKDCDEDSNGQIDFGEFCNLVQRMWDANFASIRVKAEEAKRKAEIARQEEMKAGNLSHRSCNAEQREYEPPRNWARTISERVEEELEPHSPASDDMIKKLEKILKQSAGEK